MKYVKSGIFVTKQESIHETLQEVSDIIAIARKAIEAGDTGLAVKNLDAVDNYIKHIARKVDIALTYVPKQIQEKEFL